MIDDGLTPEQQAARDELDDLLQRHCKLLGPWQETADDQPVPDNVFLNSWVLMASWTDEEGMSYLTRIPSKNLPMYARAGLLHEGLYGFDDD